MKLISCYVTGFGAIKEYVYDFSEGMTAVCQENGWGKTTFCTFLKAMFYGMDYSARTKVLNERKHYLPWDGGICGGHIVFESEGKTYRLERTFGHTDKEDTFCLIDVVTGQESRDYSDQIGEEIFEVDREAFERSIFIPQSALPTAMTDSLNAKMGDLAAAKDDINNFDVAVSRVQEAKKSYVRKSKVNNGRLNVIKDEIRSCAEMIDKKAAVLDGYEKQMALLEEKKKSLNWMEAEKNRIAEQIRMQSRREQDMGAYRKQVEFLEKQQEEASHLDDFFVNGVPTAEEQSGMEDMERQYDVSKRAEHELSIKMPPSQQVEKWERLFSDGVPTDDEMTEWNEKALQIQELQLRGKHAKLSDDTTKQIDELKFFFSKKLPTEDELSQVEKSVVELSKLEGRLAELGEQYRNLRVRKEVAEEETKRHHGGGTLVLVVLILILAFSGLAFHFLAPRGGWNTILQLLCFGGAAGVLIGMIMHRVREKSVQKNRRNEILQQVSNLEASLHECEEERDRIADDCGAFLSHFLLTPASSMQQMVYEIRVNLEKYRHLQEEEEKATEHSTEAVEELSDIRMELYTLLGHYADVYGMDLYHEGCEAILLDHLHKDASAYEEYVNNRKQQEVLQLTMDKQKQLLDNYLIRFPLEESLQPSECLKVIQGNLKRYGQLQEEMERSRKEMEEFLRNNEGKEESVSVEVLQEQQEKLDEEIKEMNQGITQDRETLLQLSEEMDAIEEAENRRDVLMEERAECEKKVELLEKTEEFLQMAREQFLSTYMKPLRKGMDHYMTLLDEKYKGGADDMEFDITMDLAVQVRSRGVTHSSEYLSKGYQDLVALCARFALVDVLYRKEQPMIILDDPFTNLDEDKIVRGLELLKTIAKERQIIYFTCHDSRMPREKKDKA